MLNIDKVNVIIISIMQMNILATLAETWQMLTIIVIALSAGYAIARRFEGLLGKNKKGDTIVERLEKIERQIMPNGGSSMSDKIDYIRRDQNKMKQQVSEISGELKVIKDIVTVIVDKSDYMSINSTLNMLFYTIECATSDKKDIF